MNSAKKLLKQWFGYDQFRGQQEAIIEHVVQGKHALVIMPTGGGKSLCYQIPALAQDGLTLVISPLIALMKDQVDVLQQRGIDAAFINSSLSRQQRESRYTDVAAGAFNLLYVTPERFRKPEFVDIISKREISLLAVDEAHCISEWGHDFRPDYTRLREFRALLDDPTTIALTATATPDVQQDIIRQLGLQPDNVRMFHEGIDRPNLALEVEDVYGEQEKLAQILAYREHWPGSGIVYFSLIKTLSRFSDLLHQKKIPHACYHGDLETGQRKRVQEKFMASDKQLVLATNAFGMGIDKEAIRMVLHAEVPGSMEAYYQEIGRAGRDGEPAACCLLYDEQDLLIQMEFIKWNNPGADLYTRLHNLLVEDIEKVNALGRDWLQEQLLFKQRRDHRLSTALSLLDRHGVVEGNIDHGSLKVIAELPERLADQDWLNDKMRQEQQKLYALVQYTKAPDRKAYIHQYFGITNSG